MGQIDTSGVFVIETISGKVPLDVWALHNEDKVHKKFTGLAVYGVTLYDGFTPSIAGSELTGITQSYNLSTTRFIFKTTQNHPKLFVLRNTIGNQKNIEILFDPFPNREEFERQYFITHLKDWPFAGKSDLEIYEAYLSEDLRKLVVEWV